MSNKILFGLWWLATGLVILAMVVFFMEKNGSFGTAPVLKKAKTDVSMLFRDPDSVEFRDLKRCGNSDAVEGKVNGKNAFGGYVGYADFVYAGGEAVVKTPGPDGQLPGVPGTQEQLDVLTKYVKLNDACAAGWAKVAKG